MTEPITQSQKLEALMQRAIESGWELGECPPEIITITNDTVTLAYWVDYIEGEDEAKITEEWQFERLIFNHDFARALFGEWPQLMKGVIPNGLKSVTDIPRWQYYLQQAVVSDDPISYMYEAVFGNTSFEVNGVRHEWTNA